MRKSRSSISLLHLAHFIKMPFRISCHLIALHKNDLAPIYCLGLGRFLAYESNRFRLLFVFPHIQRIVLGNNRLFSRSRHCHKETILLCKHCLFYAIHVYVRTYCHLVFRLSLFGKRVIFIIGEPVFLDFACHKKRSF